MEKSILDYLENSAAKFSDKIAFTDGNESITYSQLEQKAKKIGSSIAKWGYKNKPVLVYIDKSINCIAAMLGVAYSGNFYVVIDVHMPEMRLESIVDTLSPVGAVTVKEQECESKLEFVDRVEFCENCYDNTIDETLLSSIRKKMIDSDPLYALFTSGSTGVPKGAVVSHRNVLAYTQWVTDAFDINSHTVFGSQTPFYFSMSVTDIFSSIKNSATFVIIPKSLFTFPLKLLEFLNEQKVNTIYWVPSALCIIANWKALDYVSLPHLKKVMFAGEVMPTHQLNVWIEHLPDAMFANLFGPTETTDICSYYVVDRKLSDEESVPIGKSCDNCDLIIIGDDGKEVPKGQQGELFVRGPFVVSGYYNNPEKTSQAFVQNPLHTAYPEIVYKTGDIVKYNDNDELIYIGRKDFQIKHMGYRIELGEIEASLTSVEGIMAVCCVFDEVKDKIVLAYEGRSVSEEAALEAVKSKVPEYMVPNVILKLKQMPHNANGKIDRKYLKENYKQIKKEQKKEKN